MFFSFNCFFLHVHVSGAFQILGPCSGKGYVMKIMGSFPHVHFFSMLYSSDLAGCVQPEQECIVWQELERIPTRANDKKQN